MSPFIQQRSMSSLVLVITCLSIIQSVRSMSMQSANRIVVAGATGRVGSLVITELLNRENGTFVVRALVRDLEKAKKTLPAKSDRLEIVKCDLGAKSDISKACKDSDAMIWCATGFSENSSPLDKFFALFKLKFTPKESIDVAALSQIGEIYSKKITEESTSPQVIMCSSAGVTRPSWSEDKKLRYPGAADIPIVRLNPFNILNIKKDGEQALRDSGALYTIVRPTGLNDKFASGGRPLFSQGDVAVGRITRLDVANVLVSLLEEKNAQAAVGKTVEVLALSGYKAPRDNSQQLNRLQQDPYKVVNKKIATRQDIGLELSESVLDVTYALMQQLVPGETLAPQKLAMGQTYEELDQGKEGKFGKRGEEKTPAGFRGSVGDLPEPNTN